MSVAESRNSTLNDEFARLVGANHVLTDETSRVLLSQDVYTKGIAAMVVVQPATTEELAAVVKAAVDAGHAVIARGGGMSYTSGYVPTEEGSVLVDMQRMNGIVELNAVDMYVTVQAGCTWKSLAEALEGTGLRTPYWGTLSGIHATVGGGASQNSIFWGSGRHGTAADSIIGLEVVLADGTVLKTGANAQRNSGPFFRHFGPDLTGLFCCDTGSLGLKATVTMRLAPVCEHREHLAFDFADESSLISAMSEIARAGVADECFGFDPKLQTVRMQRESLMSDVKKLAGVMKAGGSVFGALKDGAKVALAGRGFMKGVQYSLNIMIEERVAEAAAAGAAEVRSICARYTGKEIENSIPKILRANPFTPLNNMVGPNGERWVPIHTIVPHSKAESTVQAISDVFEKNENLMEKHGIGVGFLYATVSTNGFVIEPVFFTPDSLNEIHEEYVEDHVLKKMPGFDADPAAQEATARIRGELIDLFERVGGIHMQIGKSYPYRSGLRQESWRIVDAIKDTVDPNRRINPGSLGLD